MKSQKTPIKSMKKTPNVQAFGVTATLSLAALAMTLATMNSPKMLTADTRAPQRGLAAAFGNLANPPSSVNVASILNTFQTPSSLLGLNQMTSQIQARMQSAVPAGTPVWDGQGPLPGAIGSAGFSPSFSFDTSSCSVVSMTFYDVYMPAMNLPTVWCGAVSNQQTKPAQVSMAGLGDASGDQPHAVQLGSARPAI